MTLLEQILENAKNELLWASSKPGMDTSSIRFRIAQIEKQIQEAEFARHEAKEVL